MKPGSLSVHFAAGETGWVLDNGDGTVTIDNIPMTTGYNLGDVVKLGPPIPHCCDRPTLGEVISRKYKHKSLISYLPADQATYDKLKVPLVAAGFKVEGWTGGFMAVAHNGRPQKVFDAALQGVDVDWELEDE